MSKPEQSPIVGGGGRVLMIFKKLRGYMQEKSENNEPDTGVDVANRDLELLHPKLREDIELLLEKAHMGGLQLFVFEGRRSFARQKYLYERGRKDKGKAIVTNAADGLSFHNYGLAVDLVFDADGGKAGMQWSWTGDYQKLGILTNDFSRLEWGGNWKRFPEFCHVQMSCGFSISQIKAMYDKDGIEAVWQAITEAYEETEE